MKAVLQRVTCANVVVKGDDAGQRAIGRGFMVLVGFCADDDNATVEYIANKIIGMRVFEDDAGAMNLSLADSGGSLLVVSQFTLYADCRKGRRPSFIAAAKPVQAIPLYEHFLDVLRKTGTNVKSGEFGADMQVTLTNDGPVTILLDSAEIMPRLK